MDQLIQAARQLFPQASDEEIRSGIEQILKETPDADPNDIIEAAKGIKGAMDSGEWQRQIDASLDQQVNKKLQMQTLQERSDKDGQNFLKQLMANKGVE